ncbi:MAG: VirK/YbjX family protein [Rhodanobacter sp.]
MDMRNFLRSMQGRTDWRGSAPKRSMYAIKYAVRSLRHRTLHAAWLDFVYGTPHLRGLLADDPRLLERPQHDYINRQLGAAAGYAIVRSHHDYVLANFPPAMIERIYRHGRCPVGTLPLKDGEKLSVELRRPTGRGREGELALYLLDAQGRALSSAIFTLADDGRRLLLGCLQGATTELGREAVRMLTRQCHGLRPKNLLLSILLGFAEYLGVERVSGVSNAAHPFAGQGDKIKADYDSFWLECDGVAGSDGFFELPPREPQRDIAAVESKHRSAFRKREALRCEAAALLPHALGYSLPLALAS